jgi:transposase
VWALIAPKMSWLYVSVSLPCLGRKATRQRVFSVIHSKDLNPARAGKWSDKLSAKGIAVDFVIEATGVYHESVTHFLFDKGRKISVVLPNQARHFAQTIKVRTVNDKESSKMLASFGLQKQLDGWQKPDPVYAQLKGLTRESRTCGKE